jgi:hypothetical protein
LPVLPPTSWRPCVSAFCPRGSPPPQNAPLTRSLPRPLPKEGLEPSPCCQDGILNPARLPVPPLRPNHLSRIIHNPSTLSTQILHVTLSAAQSPRAAAEYRGGLTIRGTAGSPLPSTKVGSLLKWLSEAVPQIEFRRLPLPFYRSNSTIADIPARSLPSGSSMRTVIAPSLGSRGRGAETTATFVTRPSNST